MAELEALRTILLNVLFKRANGEARDRFLTRLGFLDHFGEILRRGKPNGTRTPVVPEKGRSGRSENRTFAGLRAMSGGFNFFFAQQDQMPLVPTSSSTCESSVEKREGI
jgi:hypothetical protein